VKFDLTIVKAGHRGDVEKIAEALLALAVVSET
jgi:hypothetical protein